MTNFFISYTQADQSWAEWIALTLEAAGYTTKIQAWDFRPGQNFVVEMQRAAAGSERTIAVLSPDYLKSVFAMAEWAAAFVADPDGSKAKLVPVLVHKTQLEGLMPSIIYISLVDLQEAEARETLIKGLAPGPVRPERVRFPGTRLFPGPNAQPPNAEAAKTAVESLPLDEVPAPGPLPVGSRMPFAVNPLFVGREADLRALALQLRSHETAAVGQIAAASGLGGIGKTQLASEFAHRYGQFFQGGVFWMSFAEAGSVPAEVAACGSSLGLHLSFETLTLDQQVRLVEEAWKSPIPRLLVFDNCEEEELLRRWRPPFGGSRVLLTSRRSDWNLSLGVRTVPLTILARQASLELLCRFRSDIPITDTSLNGIAEELGDLPLALHLAGCFLRTYRNSDHGQPATYLKSLRQKDLLAHPSMEGRGAGFLPTGHDAHVGRTFAISLERLDPAKPVDSLAIKILARAAWCAPGEPIPRGLLLRSVQSQSAEWTADLDTEDALSRLTDLGLLEPNDRSDLLMHRLVGAWARSTSSNNDAQVAIEEAVLEEATRLNENSNPAALLAWQLHLRAVTDRAVAREDQQAARLCHELGLHLWQAGNYSEARLYLKRAVAFHVEVSGPEHPETATTLNTLGCVQLSQGDFSEAYSNYERSLSIREKILGTEHPDTARSLNDLGVVLADLGDYEKARIYYERAIAIREKTLGSQHSDTATSLGTLGHLLLSQRDYEGARTYTERALAIMENVLGLDHPKTATCLSNLGVILQSQGNYKVARTYQERALAIQEKVLGSQHPSTAACLNNLANLLQLDGDMKGAYTYTERALAIQEKTLGSEHQDTAKSLLNLGILCFNQKNFSRARWYMGRAFSILRDQLGQDHPTTQEARIRLSLLPGARHTTKPFYKKKF